MKKMTREELAARLARDIPEGAYVNLGIGLPTMVANFLPADTDVFLQSENGLLGMGPPPAGGQEDYDLINAGKIPVTLLRGGSYFHQADSFAMMRGGHLDICVLGAFQVSIQGDLANWHTGAPDAIPAVGGAMDLAGGAKQVYVMMELLTKSGESKLVAQCSYPITALRCVARVYTDMAIFDLSPHGVAVTEMVSGICLEDLRCLTGVPLRAASNLREDCSLLTMPTFATRFVLPSVDTVGRWLMCGRMSWAHFHCGRSCNAIRA